MKGRGICFVPLVIFCASCGVSQDEKDRVAAVSCSIMAESRNMDAAIRVEKINDAREKIGGEAFLDGDDGIKEALKYGLCKELVLGEGYHALLAERKDVETKNQRIAAEKQAEVDRVARISAEKQAEVDRVAVRVAARVAAENKSIAKQLWRSVLVRDLSDFRPSIVAVKWGRSQEFLSIKIHVRKIIEEQLFST